MDNTPNHSQILNGGPPIGPLKGEILSTEVPVMEIMTPNPVTISRRESAHKAALLMKEGNVGSLVVVQDGMPVGIITERDLVMKVLAEDAVPSEISVDQIMSSPVISVHPHTSVTDAAKQMAKLRVRRLVVSEEDELKGILTESDLLKIWPQLIEVTREYSLISTPERVRGRYAGYCELCKTFSYDLVETGGQLLCRECREG